MENKLQKAKLYKIMDGNETSFDVQFNPETLKVTYANQVSPPTNSSTGDLISVPRFAGPRNADDKNIALSTGFIS